MQKMPNKNYLIHIISAILLVAVPAILPYFIYKTVMFAGDYGLYDQISLGAVLVGMASAIITIAASHMDRQYDRVMLDVDIFFKDLTGPGKWRRWPFVPRFKIKKLISGATHQITLKNPKVEFDLGTHTVEIFIPTCLPDFFDLPAFSTFFRMWSNDKKFYSYVERNNISGLIDPGIAQKNSDGWMIWDCLYDIWKTVVIYRLEELMIRFFAVFIFSSVFLSFLFSQITTIIAGILGV